VHQKFHFDKSLFALVRLNMSSTLNNARKGSPAKKHLRNISRFVDLEAGCSDSDSGAASDGSSLSSFFGDDDSDSQDVHAHRRLASFAPAPVAVRKRPYQDLLERMEREYGPRPRPSRFHASSESDDGDDGDTSRHHRHHSTFQPNRTLESPTQVLLTEMNSDDPPPVYDYPVRRTKLVTRRKKVVQSDSESGDEISRTESVRGHGDDPEGSESSGEESLVTEQRGRESDQEVEEEARQRELFPQDVQLSEKYDGKSRVGSFCFVYFPYARDDPVGKGVLGADGVWQPTAAHLALCMRGDKTVMTPSMERIRNHPSAQMCKLGGQWEYAPSTGILHFQGYIQCMTKPSKKNPESKQFKAVAAVYASRLRECHADDAAMESVDGYRLADKSFNFNLSPGIDVRKMVVYSTRLTNPDGSVKRAFGDAVLWALNESMTDEVRCGSSLGQMTSMILGGQTPLDTLARFPGQGMQYWRNMQGIAAEVKNKRSDMGSLRRCGNPFCGLPMCDEVTARSRAEMLDMTYNDYVEKANSPCDVGAMYSYGEAGTGKSTFSFAVAKMENPGGVFVKPGDAYWGSLAGKKYEGEEGLVIHDVAVGHFAGGGGKPFDNFKNVVDCTHLSVPLKGGTVPCYVKRFYFDGNIDPCSFFLDLIGEGKQDHVYSMEYPAFRRRIKVLFYYSRSADGAVRCVGQTMPTLQSFLKTLSLRRKWLISKDSSPIPSFEYGTSVVPIAGETHGTLSARASDVVFMERFASQIRR